MNIEIEGIEEHPWRRLKMVEQDNAVAHLLKGLSEEENKILSSHMGFSGTTTLGLKIRVDDLDLLMTIYYDEPKYTTVNFYSFNRFSFFKKQIKINNRMEGNALVKMLIESGLCESIHNWIHDNGITFAESEASSVGYRYVGPSPSYGELGRFQFS